MTPSRPSEGHSATAEGALAGLRVLDLTHYLAGPYATKLMAGFGAEVIKVERPTTGDRARGFGPFVKHEPNPETSIPFLFLNTGKQSITLNLKSEVGKDIFKRLARDADVVVENFSPRVMPSLGLDYDALRAVNPRLVMTSISNFGQTGPYRDFAADEIVEYALSGLMYLTGDPARAPLCAGPAVTQSTAGLCAYIATLMALFQRNLTGEGRRVDVSIHEAALDNIEIALAEHLQAGAIAKRRNDEHPLVPWQLYPCQDGYAAVIGGPIRHWLPGAELFEAPELLERYPHMGDRITHRREVEMLIRPWISRHAKKAIYHAGQARRLAFGYLATLADVFESPQHAAREFFVEIDHPVAGAHPYAGAPFRSPETSWRSARAPLLGEHNEKVYAGLLGCAPGELRRLEAEGII